MNKASVLVVDDDVDVCRILHHMLTDEKYQVQETQSVADAMAAIDQNLFDVYVVDFNLTAPSPSSITANRPNSLKA